METRTLSPMWRLRLGAIFGALGSADVDTLFSLYGALVGLSRGLRVPSALKATRESVLAYGAAVFAELAEAEGEDAIYAEGEALLAAMSAPSSEEVASVRGNSAGAPTS